MRLGILLIIASSLLSCTTGCKEISKIPEPEITACRQLYSVDKQLYYYFCINQTTKQETEVAFDEYYKQKPVCVTAREYTSILNYIDTMRTEIKKNCN